MPSSFRRFVLSLCLLVVCSAAAQNMEPFRNVIPKGYDFWVYSPARSVDSDSVRPLVIFLHGHSLCGHNLDRVLRYGVLHAIQRGLPLDAFVLAPQNPGGPWDPDKIDQALQWTQSHFPVDTDRVYVFGMSLGGYGTIAFVNAYPNKVAAAIELCGGGGVRSDFCGLTQVPFWIVHGTADRAVPISQADKVVRAMKKCGDTSRLRYTRLNGINHSFPARVFYLQEPYLWLFQHRLSDTGRTVSHDFDLSIDMLKSAYRQQYSSRSNHVSVKKNVGKKHRSSAKKHGAKKGRHHRKKHSKK